MTTSNNFAGIVAQALAQGAAAQTPETPVVVVPQKATRKIRLGADAAKASTPTVNPKPVKATEAKAQNKPVSAPKATPKAQAAKPRFAVAYSVKQGFRPKAGTLLSAFTHAWLSLSGLAAGGKITRSQATAIAGSTAIGYHLTQTECLAQDENGMVYITEAGHAKFSTRPGIGKGVPAELVGAYVELMTTGKPNDTVSIKNDYAIVKIA